MLLVFLPVAAMTGGAIFWQSHIPTAEQSVGLGLGANEAWIQIAGGPDPSRWQSVDSTWEYGVDVDDAGVPVNPVLPLPRAFPISCPREARCSRSKSGRSLYVETATGSAACR